jgi:RimJ/RimL family protein N-acetyltransferase
MTRAPVTRTDKLGEFFTLRPYLPDDRQALERMYEAFEPKRIAQGLPPADPGQRTRWLDTILASGNHVVVEVEGRLAGHGMLLPFGEDSAELANFLHQGVRDRGIGTALNKELLATAVEQGIARVWLSVEPSNRPAIRSYEKVGFRRRAMSHWSPELEMEVVVAARS